MSNPKIYADFHNADARGRIRLNTTGTVEDLSAKGIELREGLAITLYSDDADANGNLDELLGDGTVTYSADEGCWVAAIDWDAIRHASDDARSDFNSDGRNGNQLTTPESIGKASRTP